MNMGMIKAALLSRSALPPQYQRVEYLKSTGTQYIVTDFIPRIGDEISCEFQMFLDGDSAPFYSTNAVDSGNQLAFLCLINQAVFLKYFTTGSASALSVVDVKNTFIGRYGRFKYDKEGVVYFDDIVKTEAEKSRTKYQTNAPLYIFARSNLATKSYLNMKTFTVTRDGLTVFNAIPCRRKSDNKPGMWDTVSKTFLTNAGTGSDFVLGPDVI